MTDSEPASPDEPATRDEVRTWLARRWRGTNRRAFLAEAADAGWVVPTWPEDFYGRGLSEAAGRVVREEFGRVGAPQFLGGNVIAFNVIRAFGATEELRTTVIRGFLTGEFEVCLLYSEPGAGSDLAAVQTRAERDGDEWVVNGQKVWTTGGRTATHGLLVARTDWDVPKHQGLSFFVLPMQADGIEVRPIRQITGEAEFNEVFLTDARVPDVYRLGEPTEGWRVLQTALAVERMLMGGGVGGRARSQGSDAGAPGAGGGADLVTLARQRSRNTDPVARQELARLLTLQRIGRWNAQRAANAADQRLASLLKLAMSEVLHGSARLQGHLLGAEAMLYGDASPAADGANRAAMYAFVNSIGGGSDQIQRNIIGERILGLPKEPQVDRDVPFREVRKADARRDFGA